jgi:hypothetical protein
MRMTTEVADRANLAAAMPVAEGGWNRASATAGAPRPVIRLLKVCAWCRRVEHNGRWMPIEGSVEVSYGAPISHGICHDCLQAELKKDMEPARQLTATVSN